MELQGWNDLSMDASSAGRMQRLQLGNLQGGISSITKGHDIHQLTNADQHPGCNPVANELVAAQLRARPGQPYC
jgi:hypothetical protein